MEPKWFIFPVGIVALLLFARHKGLFGSKETKLKSRLIVGFWMGALFLTQVDAEYLGIGVPVGILLAALMSWYFQRDLKRKIVGRTIVLKSDFYRRSHRGATLTTLTLVLLCGITRIVFGPINEHFMNSLDAIFLVIAAILLFFSVFAFIFVSIMEKKLGGEIYVRIP